MYFRDPKKKLPKYYKTVFVRQRGNYYNFAFYSATGEWYPDDGDVLFSIDVIGWMPIAELNSIEVK